MKYSFPVNRYVSAVLLSDDCLLRCPTCGELRPLQLRSLPAGEMFRTLTGEAEAVEIRNQPHCGSCRGTWEKGKKK